MKDLVLIVAFDIEGIQIGYWSKQQFRRYKSYNNVATVHEYTIDTENLTVTKRTWVKDIHGQLHEATGIKPVV